MGMDRDRRGLDQRMPLRMVEITPLGLRVAKVEAQRLEALAHAARIGGLLERRAT